MSDQLIRPARRRFRRFLPRALQERDLAAFRAVAEWHAPALDATLPRLTRAANNSLLWLGIAGALAATRNRRARRAATRGVLAIAATSAITNIPAKLLFRRERPDSALIPLARRLARVPTTTSFPSGHSASAFAFATGASLELPPAAPALGFLASAVAFSRVYTGAHYPSDVLTGAAIGAGLAIASQRLWPVPPAEPAHGRSALATGSLQRSPEGEGVVIVVNSSAGPALAPDPADALRDALPAAKIVEVDDPESFPAALRRAAEEGTAIGAAGGDGSMGAAAAIALEADKPLVVVPGGTLNHFARDAGIASAGDAADAVRAGSVASVDLGMLDDEPFLNTAGIGAYPQLVDERERLEHRLGKWPAAFVAMVRVLRRAEPLEVEIDGVRRRIWMMFVGNCRYSPSGYAPNRRARLDDGCFDVRIVSAERRGWMARALLGLLGGRLRRSGVYEERVTDTLEIRSLDGPLRVSRDGETFDAPESVRVRKASRRLVVFVPES